MLVLPYPYNTSDLNGIAHKEIRLTAYLKKKNVDDVYTVTMGCQM